VINKKGYHKSTQHPNINYEGIYPGNIMRFRIVMLFQLLLQKDGKLKTSFNAGSLHNINRDVVFKEIACHLEILRNFQISSAFDAYVRTKGWKSVDKDNYLGQHIQRMLKNIMSLHPKEEWALAAGFDRHSLYIVFRRLLDKRFEVRVDNVGGGSNRHRIVKGNWSLTFPYVFEPFTISNKGKHIETYLSNILEYRMKGVFEESFWTHRERTNQILSLVYDEANAFFTFNTNHQLTNPLYPARQKQTVGNCSYASLSLGTFYRLLLWTGAEETFQKVQAFEEAFVDEMKVAYFQTEPQDQHDKNKGEENNTQRPSKKALRPIEDYTMENKSKTKSAKAEKMLGNQCWAKGQLEQSIIHYMAAIKLWPECKEAWNNLGMSYFKLRYYEIAASAFKQAIKIDENYIKPRQYRVNVKSGV
jgi:tetratricopeptide (TPR) repeat protein